jgi:hypothetical protein
VARPKKTLLPAGGQQGEAPNNGQGVHLIVVAALALGRIDDRLNDNKGHAGANDTQRIPETAHENNMGHIPDPFEIKGEHTLASLKIGVSGFRRGHFRFFGTRLVVIGFSGRFHNR